MRNPRIEDSGKTLSFHDDDLELTFEAETGRWLDMTERAEGRRLLQGGGAQSPVVFSVGGISTASRAFIASSC